MWRIFFVACALTVSGAMGAGASNDSGSFESPRQLNDSVVVTANRVGVKRTQSVWPTAVVDLDHGPSAVSLDTRLEGAGGLDIRSYNGVGSVATLSSWGVFNRQMLLLYNGRPVKDYSLGGFNLADFSAAEIDRVEIVKGPQSAFYGSDAVGGVVNLITRSSLVDRVDFHSRFGNNAYRDYSVSASRKLGEIGVGAWAERLSTDNRRSNAGAERTLVGLHSDVLTGKHRLRLSARYFEDSLGVPGPVPDPAFVPVYGSADASSLTDHQTDQNYSVDLQYRFADDRLGEAQVDMFWEKKNLHYHSLYNYQSWYSVIDSAVTPPDTSDAIDSVDVHATTIYNKRSSGISGRYLKEVGAMSLAGGVDFLSGSLRTTNVDQADATNISGPYAPYGYDYSTYTFWSGRQNQLDLWGSHGWQPTGYLRTDISGRLQFVKGRTTQPSYDLGLIVAPSESWRLKIGYAYAFRLPTIAEQFADDVYTQGNTDLNPETAHTLIGTLSISPEELPVSFSATVFHQNVDSLIQYRYDPTIYRSVPRNFEKFRSTGLDATVTARLRDDLSLRWNGVYQSAKQSADHGDRMVEAAYVPDLKWRGDLDVVRGNITVNANLTFTSARMIYLYDGSRKDIAKVYELGGAVGVKLSELVKLSVTGYDLTDRRRPDQFGFTLTDGDYPGLGRQVLIELNVGLH